MLLFVKGKALAQIAAGRKTATVRPWRRCKLQPGTVLSFNGRVRVTLLRVELVARLDALPVASARAAGFSSRIACVRAMRANYPALDVSAPCVVLHFALPAQ